MADDIDIEEHDLMADPKLRSMFPDLSLLKQEILDPYISENKNQDCLQISNEYGNVNPSFVVKTEPSSNETGATSNIAINIQSNSNISVNRDTNFRTKIILGSKPSVEKVNDKKLKCKVSVHLQNIRADLVQSMKYCDTCYILFSSKQDYESHVCCDHSLNRKTQNPNHREVKLKPFSESNQSNVMTHINNNNVQKANGESHNKCFHCNVVFSSQKSLIDHLYDILENKNCKSKNLEKSTRVNNVKCNRNNDLVNNINCDEGENVYQCHICSYYFNQKKFYEVHLLKKHRLSIPNNITKVVFNPKCKYCNIEFINIKYYNLHMLKKHKDFVSKVVGNVCSQINVDANNDCNSKEDSGDDFDINRNSSLEISNNNSVSKRKSDIFLNYGNNLTFKSIIFKCLTCHIHFLSPDVAINHEDHDQMLINMKCSQCLKIFKRNDEILHSEQHLHTTSFTVYELSDADSGKVLIRCSKCSINFHEQDFVNHNLFCGNVHLSSTYCSHCDILVDEKVMKIHNNHHKNKEKTAFDFILIDYSKQAMPTLNSCREIALKRKQPLNKLSKSLKLMKTPEDTNSSDSEITPLSDIAKLTELRKSLVGETDSCSDVESYHEPLSPPSKQDRKKVSNVAIIDSDSEQLSIGIKIMRKKVAEKIRKNSKSKKINYKNINQMFLLHVTYCAYCECFLTAHYKLDVHLKLRCTEIQKRVCKICGIIVTGKASSSHKALHKLNPKLQLKDFTFYDIKTSEIICPPIPKYPKCDICDVHFTSKVDVSRHVCNQNNIAQCHICKIKLSDIAFKLHMPFHEYLLGNKEAKILGNDVASSTALQNVADNLELKEPEIIKNNELIMEVQNSTDTHSFCIIFTCKSCNLSLCTYDDLINHCHLHCVKDEISSKTDECRFCSLNFETCSSKLHQKLHFEGKTKEDFKIVLVDVFYFGCSDEEWTKHLFETLSKNEKAIILETSIYRYERRIKMEITQQGPWDLLMYRCEKCRSFVDNIIVYKHVLNCLGKYRLNPCKICGVNLLSTTTRSEHQETVHKRTGITLKSYKIVSFNRKDHSVLNNAIANKNNYYILYKCRNCNGIVGNKELNHQCYVGNLEKCVYCGLLLYEENYEQHISKHVNFESFKQTNMKVILVGNKSMENRKNTLGCSFSGIVYDYKFYKCLKCEVCVRNVKPKHSCLIDEAKLKCPKCNLFFDEGKLKYHTKQHNIDPDFVRNNMLVIDFNPENPNKCLEDDEDLGDELITRSDGKSDTKTIIEKSDTVYKCACGLHHLSRSSYNEHSKRNSTKGSSCDSKKKNNKQTCFKCGLDFTPNVLFKHLLIHHGDINVVYKLDVVEPEIESYKSKSDDEIGQ